MTSKKELLKRLQSLEEQLGFSYCPENEYEKHLSNSEWSFESRLKKLEDKNTLHHERTKLLSRYYKNFTEDSYQWLTKTSPTLSEFSDDIIEFIDIHIIQRCINFIENTKRCGLQEINSEKQCCCRKCFFAP